jgi:ribosome maturation factor RimP
MQGREAGAAWRLGNERCAALPKSVRLESPPRGFLFLVGLKAHFCLGGAPFVVPQRGSGSVTGTLRERLIALIEPVVERAGFELVELEHGHGQVRLFIDAAAGVKLDDCATVSREVSRLLDAEDPIPHAYTLEVSSPGLDRVLRTRAHFDRFRGAQVLVELKEPRDGRRRYTGKLMSVDATGIALEVDTQHVALGFNEIGKARLATS